MKKRCQYYSEKVKVYRHKNLTGSRSPSKPTTTVEKKCSHEQSEHQPGIIAGNVSCEGDESLCVIPGRSR